MSSADTDTTEEEAAPERDERREALLGRIQHLLGDRLLAHEIDPGHELWIRVGRDDWVDTLRTMRFDLHLTFFEFLAAIDWMPSPFGKYEDAEVDTPLDLASADTTPQPGVTGGDTRFQIFARLGNLANGDFVVIKADLPDDDLSVPTCISVYPGANWHERETAEMFGIDFPGHPYLQKLYLPGGFEGHPLRKDFPLVARIVKPWPGIVDVEPMPDDDADDAEEEGGDS